LPLVTLTAMNRPLRVMNDRGLDEALRPAPGASRFRAVLCEIG